MTISAKSLTNIYNRFPDVINLGAIFVCVIAVYWPVYSFRFLHGWDDQWAVLNSYTEDGFTGSNIYAVLTTFYGGQYAPVNQFYYMAMYYFFGYDPMYYHIGSVVIHIVNITLVYHLIKKITTKLVGELSSSSLQIAFLTTILFAVSPFNVEPVAWVSAAKVILYALFYLLALHGYLYYLDTKRPLYFYLTLLFFVISFGAKEQAVTLPLCLVLFDYLYKRPLKDKSLWLEKIPFFITAFLFGYVSIQSQGKELFEASDFYPFYQRIILSFYTFSEYFTKSVFPINLSYLYPFPFQVGDAVPLYLWLYPIAIIALVVAYYKAWQKRTWLVFGTLFFIIHLILVINLLSLARYSIVADRYAYIATSSIYFMGAIIFTKGLKNKQLKKWMYTAGCIYFLYFMSYARFHSFAWKNALTLKEHLKKTIRSRSDYKDWQIRNLSK